MSDIYCQKFELKNRHVEKKSFHQKNNNVMSKKHKKVYTA